MASDTNLFLTTKEFAHFENVTRQSIEKKIKNGSIIPIKVETEKKKGVKYLLPFEALTPSAKRRYYAKLKAEFSASGEENALFNEPLEKYNKTMEDLTEGQRIQVSQWRQILSDYGVFIGPYWKQRTEMTKVFVEQIKDKYPDLHISPRTISRKQKLLAECGEVALADCRKAGNRLNKGNVLKPEVKAAFEQYWLDEGRPSVTAARKLVNDLAELEHPEWLPLPSIATFQRHSRTIDNTIIQYYRYGNKAFEDKCLPYVERSYLKIESNEIWQSDYHTLDFWVKDDMTGEKFRPHLIVWLDIRSRKVMSFGLFRSSNSDGTIITLGKAIAKYGIPKVVYLDNGREFLTSDFGGRGVRKTDVNADCGSTILDRLGIEMRNAKVANGKAKIIERYFKEVKENFSRFIATYTGGKPEERPERLEGVLKDNNVPLLSKAMELIGLFIEGNYNAVSSNASGLKGKTPNQCYRDNLFKKRTATQDDLKLMMLRTARLQTVARNGVKLKMNGEYIWYYSTELAMNWQGKKVYVRYNPEELQSVRIYNEKEQFVGTADLKQKGGYDFGKGSDIEAIKENNAEKKKIKKAVKAYKKTLANIIEIPEATEIIERAASARIENENNIYSSKILEPVRCEDEEYKKAVGEYRKIDFSDIVARLTEGRE